VRPLLLLAMSDFLEPGGGPEQSGDFRISPSFFIVLFGIGFAIGVVGHLVRSRVLVATGVLLVMLATVFLPIALAVSR
jgi:Flp pilus assembly protein TadB